jgi:hypothetical protein
MPKTKKEYQKELKNIVEDFNKKFSQIIKKTDGVIDKFILEVEKEKKKRNK